MDNKNKILVKEIFTNIFNILLQAIKKKKINKNLVLYDKKKHLSGNWNYFIHMNINKWQCVIIGKIRNKIQLKKSLKDKTWMIEKVLIC